METRPRRLRSAVAQPGYTLLELLLYIAVIGSLLTALTTFLGLAVEARVKNQSIAEVNEQGTAAMDYITQTIRNATAVTVPAAGASGSSLTLTVPTGALSPTVFNTAGSGTVLGFNADGGSTDSNDSGFINATKFTATASGTITNLFAFVGPTIGTSPNNQAQMAIYSGTVPPLTLLASSASTTLTPSAWNSFTISPVSVTSGQTYWLAYNTNGTGLSQNNLRWHAGATQQTVFGAQTFGTWPASFNSNQFSNDEDSMYALISTGGGSGALQVTEGAGSAVPLTGDNITISNLTFKNLTRTGTNGVVQISFTVTRNNPSGRNEYNYQKTFTSTAEVGW